MSRSARHNCFVSIGASRWRLRAALCCSLAATGCAGGVPLLHRAQPLTQGNVAASVGTYRVLPSRTENHAVRRSDAMMRRQGGATDLGLLAEGAAVQVLSAPGPAPYFALRYGLGSQREGGISYTGRRVRGDLRQAWLLDHLTLSVGVALLGIPPEIGAQPRRATCLPGAPCPVTVDSEYSSIDGLDATSVTGWGAELPLMLGWTSHADVVAAWFGLRARLEGHSGDLRYRDASEVPSVVDVEGTLGGLGGSIGASIGVPLFRVMVGMEASVQSLLLQLHAPKWTRRAQLTGVTFMPAAAVELSF